MIYELYVTIIFSCPTLVSKHPKSVEKSLWPLCRLAQLDLSPWSRNFFHESGLLEQTHSPGTPPFSLPPLHPPPPTVQKSVAQIKGSYSSFSSPNTMNESHYTCDSTFRIMMKILGNPSSHVAYYVVIHSWKTNLIFLRDHWGHSVQQVSVSPVAKVRDWGALVRRVRSFPLGPFFHGGGITWICHLGKYRVINSSWPLKKKKKVLWIIFTITKASCEGRIVWTQSGQCQLFGNRNKRTENKDLCESLLDSGNALTLCLYYLLPDNCSQQWKASSPSGNGFKYKWLRFLSKVHCGWHPLLHPPIPSRALHFHFITFFPPRAG